MLRAYEEYDALVRDLLTRTWSNKAITESYIPGSTFKVITSAMALEENKVKITETVNCPGYKVVLGRKIRCHETHGHGTLNFAEGIQHSCNVWFMTVGFAWELTNIRNTSGPSDTGKNRNRPSRRGGNSILFRR